MRLMRWFGVGVLIIGILLLLDFASKNINPNVSAANSGLLALLFGCLLIGADAFSKRVNLSQTATNLSVMIVAGWTILSSGLLVALLGFLLENQVMCNCPASGPCNCGVLLYSVMFYTGLSGSLIGAGLIVAGTIQSRKKEAPLKPVSPLQSKTNPHARRNTMLVVALTIVMVFALFSYWPGVYITSINEQGHFLAGIPSAEGVQNPNFPSFMTSPTVQSGSGLQLPIGGSFVYVLHFSSVPSYAEYRIDKPSVNFGFSITSMNVSFPLLISSSDPSVSVVFHIRGPVYPYYGTFSIFLNFENVTHTGSS